MRTAIQRRSAPQLTGRCFDDRTISCTELNNSRVYPHRFAGSDNACKDSVPGGRIPETGNRKLETDESKRCFSLLAGSSNRLGCLFPRNQNKLMSTTRTRRSQTPPTPVEPKTAGAQIVEGLRIAARLLTLAIVAYGPWYYGSASWNSQVVCVIASLAALILALLTWDRSLPIRIGVPHGCLAFLLVLAMAQSIPLPDPLWTWFSPNADFASEVQLLADELLVEERSDEPEISTAPIQQIDYPRTISVFPNQSLATAAVLGSALAMMLVGSLLFTTNVWKIGLLITLTVVGLSNAMVGLMQTVGDWTLLPMSGSFFATFVNRNSVPQYYSISLGSAIGLMAWWHSRRRGGSLEKRYHVRYPAVNILARLRRRVDEVFTDLDAFSIVTLLAIVVLLAAVLASTSRGGILACAIALLMTTAALLGRRGNAGAISLAVLVVGLVCMGLLVALGLESRISERIDTVSEEFHQLSNVRLALWRAVLGESRYWMLGSGYGTFHLAVLTCTLPGQPFWFYHAENIYVETMVTLGILGFLAVVTGIAWMLTKLLFVERKRQSFLRVAALFPIVAIGVQGMTDFSVMLPAIFLPFSLIVGAVVSELGMQSSPHRHRSSRTRRREAAGRSMEEQREGFRAVLQAHVNQAGSQVPERSRPWPQLGLALIVLIATACGLPKLIDLGKAEVLARRAGEQYSMSINTAFELARQQQKQFSELFAALDWPEEVREADQVSLLARPEMAVAALRSPDERLQPIVSLLQEDPRLVPLLRETGEAMATTISECPQDWRACWGLLRADANLTSDAERRRNAARLLLTAHHKPSLLRDIGTHFLWTGDQPIGLAFWRSELNGLNPASIRYVVRLTSELQLLTSADVTRILPPDPFYRIRVAKDFVDYAKRPDLAASVIQDIDVGTLLPDAEGVPELQLIVWLAELDSNSNVKLDALREATRLAPMDHRISYQLALAYREVGDLELAQQELDRALRQDPSNRSYTQLRDEIADQSR